MTKIATIKPSDDKEDFSDLESGTKSVVFLNNETLDTKQDDDSASESIDSNFEPELMAMSTATRGSRKKHLSAYALSISVTAESKEEEEYDAETIRKEFETYRSILPKPDKLLQEQHSFTLLRKTIQDNGYELPRFLRYKNEGGIKPHHALCSLLLTEWHEAKTYNDMKKGKPVPAGLIETLTCGRLYRQLNHPAEFIRDQFNRVAHVVPLDVVTQTILRKKIKSRGLPVPNYFLDAEDEKQFPPHIALLVILQDGLHESQKLNSILYHMAFSLFAFIALLLRIVLEVIGGAGAIWGGAEVFTLRHGKNADLWRWISVGVGILCFLRFWVLNVPQKEDVGDILGPAGPWSLRLPVRMRAVCEHPFHYFVRALPPSLPSDKKKN